MTPVMACCAPREISLTHPFFGNEYTPGEYQAVAVLGYAGMQPLGCCVMSSMQPRKLRMYFQR